MTFGGPRPAHAGHPTALPDPDPPARSHSMEDGVVMVHLGGPIKEGTKITLRNVPPGAL